MRRRWHISRWFGHTLFWGYNLVCALLLVLNMSHHDHGHAVNVVAVVWFAPYGLLIVFVMLALIGLAVAEGAKQIAKDWPPIKRVTTPVLDDLRAVERPWPPGVCCPGCGYRRYPHRRGCHNVNDWPPTKGSS